MSCSSVSQLQIAYAVAKHKSSKGEWNLKNQEKIIRYLNDIKNPYILKVEDMVVEIEYSDVKKTFNECMANILKQKKKMG